MKVQDAVRGQLEFWHRTVEQSLAGCPQDILHARLEGSTTCPIAAVYAHAVISEDFLLSTRVRQGTAMFEADGWSDRLRIPSPGAPVITPEWASKVRLELAAFQEYSSTVYAATDAYLAALTDAELDAPLPSSSPGGRQLPAGFLIVQVMATHFPAHAGEIAALLGVAGRRGLPF